MRLLVVGLFAMLVLVPTGQVAQASTGVPAASVAALDQPTATPNPSAPAGPELNPEQAASKSRQKLVIGFIAAVLLVIVFFGRRSHNKRRKKLKGATVT